MTIAAIRGQALRTERFWEGELCLSFFQASASAESDAASRFPTGRPRNEALQSLAGGPLAGRFHAWRGGSGQRYVCSVFPVNAEPDAGLPDFCDTVVIAATRTSDGLRRPVGLCQCEPGANSYARECFIIEALAAGASEWHIHLLATEMKQRRAVIADIEAARLRGR
jgi:hypothetical protein